MNTRHMLPARVGLHASPARRGVVGGTVIALAILAFSSIMSPAPLHAAGVAHRPAARSKTILAFRTMVGNSGPYVGAAGTLRGIPAGGAPWEIASVAGVLKANGHLDIIVRGLTLLNGTNPVPSFEGAVSCQSIDSQGQANVANVFTKDFPATTSGNSVISDTVTLPTPCFAPIIFITSPAPQSWFAVTGM